MNTMDELRILQYNLHKNRERTHGILNDPDMKEYMILMIQEQFWSYVTKSSPLHHSWSLIEPQATKDKKPRAAIYVNNKYLPASCLTQLPVPSTDIVIVEISIPGSQKPILIINVYNPCDESVLPILHNYLTENLRSHRYELIIMGGDFNCHHPMWNPSEYERHDDEADSLIDLTASLGLNLMLPPGIITYPNAGTTIDLIWGNETAINNILKCKIAENQDHGSDHLPIETVISISSIQIPTSEPMFNFAKTNWEEFKKRLKQHLPSPTTQSDQSCKTRADIDKYTEQLVDAIVSAIEMTTPKIRPSPHSKRWWTEELTQLKREANRLRKVYQLTRHHIDRTAWKVKAKEYIEEIVKAKTTHWRGYIEKPDNKSIGQIIRYITNKPTSSIIPTLNGKEATNEQKVNALQKSFFPRPPSADLSDLSRSTIYPTPISYEPRITLQQIQRAVNRAAPRKAPGPDKISNLVLQHALPIIEQHLLILMQATLDLGYFPKAFKRTKTIVLRKPGKPDYTISKAYRPIALENTIGKVFESVMAESISYLTELHELLPSEHYGGRPGRSTEDAMTVLSENIHKAWKSKKLFTAVFLDVAGAFNNVHHRRLIHNLKARRLPPQIIKWIQSFLQGRSTQLHFNGSSSQSIPTPAGVPQGSPLSPILYMYYNADLLEVTKDEVDTMSLGFIDDIVYGVEGESDKQNVRKLKKLLQGAEEWRRRHGAQFERSKYVLVHFTRNTRQSTTAAISLNGTMIQPSTEAKYLGVIFDQQLRFKAHLQQVVKKGTNAALAISSIAKCNWGTPYRYARQLFQAVVAPRMDYAAMIWHRPRADGSTASSTQVRRISTVQRIAMKAILGCYRTTPTAAMEIEAGLAPAWIRLQTKVLLSGTRMQSLSTRHPIHKWLQCALRTRTASTRHQSILENMLNQFPLMTTRIETIEPYIRAPWWTSKIQVEIASDKKAAKSRHDELINSTPVNTMTIYTDGSGIMEKIGAAAYNQTLNEMAHQHLGRHSEYNVYSAELTALDLGVTMWQNHAHDYPQCYIFIDSQAACSSIQQPRRQSGQCILASILDRIDQIMEHHPQRKLKIIWIPGHMDIEGNEYADQEAKRAAIDPTVRQLFRHPPLKSSRIQQIKAMAKTQWNRQWIENTKTSKHLRRIHQSKGSNWDRNYTTRSQDEKRAHRVVQLRTGHCGLNKYLHRFGKRYSPYCSCGYAKETVEHFILECPNYKVQRKELRKMVGIWKMRIDKLLGDITLLKYTMEYVRTTKRMDN